MRGKGVRSRTGQGTRKHPSAPASDLHRGGQFPVPLHALFSQAWLCPGLCFLVLTPLSTILLPTSPAPNPSSILSSHYSHLHTFARLGPSTWQALATLTQAPGLHCPRPLPLGFETTSSREPALIHPLKANSPGLSLNLTYPFLSLHISYFCTCHLKFWLLRGGKFARESGGKNCLVSKTREETC